MFVRPLLLRVLYPDVSMDVSYSCKVTMAVRHLLNTCATVEHRVPVASTVCCLIAQESDSYVQLSSAAAVLTVLHWVFQTSSCSNDEAATVARPAREARWQAAPYFALHTKLPDRDRNHLKAAVPDVRPEQVVSWVR